MNERVGMACDCGADMPRLLLVAVAGVVVSLIGCSKTLWIAPPGGSEQQLLRDSYACRRDAATPPAPPSVAGLHWLRPSKPRLHDGSSGARPRAGRSSTGRGARRSLHGIERLSPPIDAGEVFDLRPKGRSRPVEGAASRIPFAGSRTYDFYLVMALQCTEEPALVGYLPTAA